MANCGDSVRELLASAQTDAVIIAPFIKATALRRLLAACSNGARIKVIGRFLPEDIASGVCDIEAAELLLDHPRVEFLTHPLLHAKLYRADARCLVGSANVTLRAFGWLPVANEELLIPDEYAAPIQEFEERLTSDSEVMTWPRVRELRARAREFPESARLEGEPLQSISDSEPWLPTCRTPRHLFNVYSEVDEWRILDSARAAARRDLKALEPLPLRLDRPSFEALVRSALRRHSLVQWLIAEGPVRSLDVVSSRIEPIAAKLDVSLAPELIWEAFQEWLLYFFPDEFRLVPRETTLAYGRRL